MRDSPATVSEGLDTSPLFLGGRVGQRAARGNRATTTSGVMMAGTQCGEVRRAIREAFVALDATEDAGGSATYREVAARAKVGWDIAHATVKNMARAGELVKVGRSKPAGERVWTALYALATTPPPPSPPSTTPEGMLALSMVMSTMLHAKPTVDHDAAA